MRRKVAEISGGAVCLIAAAAVCWGASSMALAQEKPAGSLPPTNRPGSAGEFDEPILPAAGSRVGAGLGLPGSATINLYGSEFRQAGLPRTRESIDKASGTESAAASRARVLRFPGLTSPFNGSGIGAASSGVSTSSHFAATSPLAAHWNDPIQSHRQSLRTILGPAIAVPGTTGGGVAKPPGEIVGKNLVNWDVTAAGSSPIQGTSPLFGGQGRFGAGASTPALFAPSPNASVAFPPCGEGLGRGSWEAGGTSVSLPLQNPIGPQAWSAVRSGGPRTLLGVHRDKPITPPRPLRPLSLR